MKRTVATCLVLAGCRALLGIDEPSVHDDATAPPTDAERIVDGPEPIDAAGTTYHASAVHFDGNAYLTRVSLENTSQSDQGTFSMWLHFDGGDGTQQVLAGASILADGGIAREASNTLHFYLPDCGGAPLLDASSTTTYTTASGWIHVLAAWNLKTSIFLLYVNGSPVTTTIKTIKDGGICYADGTIPIWGIGGLNGGSLNADVADLYAALGTFIDISLAANLDKFELNHKPVDLGSHCTTPLGGGSASIPTGCFVGSAVGWSTNAGSGGPFDSKGDPLTNAATSPSD